MTRKIVALAGCLLLTTSSAAWAGTITFDFEEFGHGDVVTASQGATISTLNFHPNASHPDLGVAFDTTASGTSDRDLEQGGGWARGNLAPSTALGNLLIVQENSAGCDTGTCSDPDDEGRRPGGSFTIELAGLGLGSFDEFAFDIVDVEDRSAENGSIEFFLGAALTSSYDFDDFLALGQGVVFGNNSANHVDLGRVGPYDTIVITMGGSGGIDNLEATMPEPGAALLFALGCTTVAVTRRLRRR